MLIRKTILGKRNDYILVHVVNAIKNCVISHRAYHNNNNNSNNKYSEKPNQIVNLTHN